jgi:cysteine-rich repeat protein
VSPLSAVAPTSVVRDTDGTFRTVPPQSPVGAQGSRFGDLRAQVGAVPEGCGNGFLERLEECDDGNTIDFDGCSFNCRLETGRCGDGIVQALLLEDCEGALDPSLGYFCSTSCQFVSLTCGDGRVSQGEQCDEAVRNSDLGGSACRTNCRLPACGDAILDPAESCDDGNALPGDGCNRYCQRENGVTIPMTFGTSIIFPPLDLRTGQVVPEETWRGSASNLEFAPLDVPGSTGRLFVPATYDMNFDRVVDATELQRAIRMSPAAQQDADDDGVPDDWERVFGTNARAAADVSWDQDGDGRTLREEWEQGTDPLRKDVPMVRPRSLQQTGPAAITFVLLGGAAGWAWMRRREQVA